MKEEQNINFVIGNYSSLIKNNYISTYALGTETLYGTRTNALQALNHVKEKVPEKKWQIFELVPLDIGQ